MINERGTLTEQVLSPIGGVQEGREVVREDENSDAGGLQKSVPSLRLAV
jgi:hypothetical protein